MMRGMNEFEPPLEALLIERLRETLPDRQATVSHVAGQAGISESRWRQIAKGYQQANRETRVRVTAPPGTLARMAAAVGATPEDLERARRPDAAQQLRKLRAPTPPAIAATDLLCEVTNDELLAEVRRRMNGPDATAVGGSGGGAGAVLTAETQTDQPRGRRKSRLAPRRDRPGM